MNYDHYALYDEVAGALRGFAAAYPALCSLSSVGKTREGRDIYCLTVCDRSTGAPEDKPAFFMDGNLHSGEVASSMAVLCTLDKWLAAFGSYPELTRLLSLYTVYAIPRVNADAAEVCLTSPAALRGSTEKYYPEEPGVRPCDLDGDGEIRRLRFRDPAGRWKPYPRDPRILL